MPVTRISDVIVPEIFTGYTINRTTELSRLVQSGAVVRDQTLDNFLAGAGLTVHSPSYRDLGNDEENVSSDDPDVYSVPKKIQTQQEIAVRLSRNNSWSTMDLVRALAGSDPMDAIANLVAGYWVRREQRLFVAEVNGVMANNALATDDYHVQNDMINSIAGTTYNNTVTTFGAGSIIDTAVTMGDAMDQLTMVMMHSVVYARALKNNLIQFVAQSNNPNAIAIPTFLGKEVIVDDGMPHDGQGVFETWMFGQGAFRMGVGSPTVPTEIERKASAGNGGGQEILHNRVERALHPEGYAYVGPTPVGGPSNAQLATAANWRRAFTERKQIRMARLLTREYAAPAA